MKLNQYFNTLVRSHCKCHQQSKGIRKFSLAIAVIALSLHGMAMGEELQRWTDSTNSLQWTYVGQRSFGSHPNDIFARCATLTPPADVPRFTYLSDDATRYNEPTQETIVLKNSLLALITNSPLAKLLHSQRSSDLEPGIWWSPAESSKVILIWIEDLLFERSSMYAYSIFIEHASTLPPPIVAMAQRRLNQLDRGISTIAALHAYGSGAWHSYIPYDLPKDKLLDGLCVSKL